MPLTLFPPRSGNDASYRIRGTVRGIYINETTGTADKALADAIRIKREAALLEESVLGPRASRRFSDAALGYAESVKPGHTQLAAIIGAPRRDGGLSPCLVSDFGAMLVAKIDQAVVDRVTRTRFKDAAPATLQRQLLTPLTAVLTWAAARKWCDLPRFQRPATPRGRSRWASYEEADRLLAAAAPHLYRLVLFLLLSGARLGEALGLRWDDIDLAAGWVVFRNTKRGKRGGRAGEDRGAPLHPQLVVMLANLARPRNGDGFVFLSSRGEPYAARLGGGHIKTAWAAALRRAGIAGLRVHDLRHSFATWLLIAGVTEEKRARIMGHESSEMTRRYAHIPDPLLVEAVRLLPTRAKSVRAAYPYPGKSNEKKVVGDE
jgi:integrase